MKGMRKIVRGAGFRGVVNYIFRHEKNEPPGIYVGGTLLDAEPSGITKEFSQTRRLRPDIKKPVWHNSLRLPAGEKISVETWHALADDYMSQMGFTELHQWIAVLHDDDEGQHIHIVSCRIDYQGKVWLGANENLISTKIISSLERKYKLVITKGVDHQDDGKIIMPDITELKKKEIEKSINTDEKPTRTILQELITSAMKAAPTTVEFMRKLESFGIKLRPNIATTGTMNGFSFEYCGLAFSGSALGKKYKWSSILKEIKYDKDRDSEEIAARILTRTYSGETSSVESQHLDRQRFGRIDDENFGPIGQQFYRNKQSTDGRVDVFGKVVLCISGGFQSNSTKICRSAESTKRRTGTSDFSDTKYRDAYEESGVSGCGYDSTHVNLYVRRKASEASIATMMHLENQKTYRQRLLRKIYGEVSDMVANYWRIDQTTMGNVVFSNKYGHIVDRGPEIECQNGNDKEIDAMFELVRIKGWQALSIQGSDEFRYRAMLKAAELNLNVNIDTDRDHHLLDRVKMELKKRLLAQKKHGPQQFSASAPPILNVSKETIRNGKTFRP